MKNSVFQFLCLMLISNIVDCKTTLNRIGNCKAGEDLAISFSGNIRNEKDDQYLEDGMLKTTVDMNDDIEVTTDLQSFENNQWKKVLDVKGKLCEIEKKYAGEFALELEKAVGIPNGCPFTKGEYKLSSHKLEFEKFAYKDFPDGKLMLKTTYLDGKTKKELGCLEIEFTMKK